MITSRKHASALFAAVLLPAAGYAQQALNEIKVVGNAENAFKAEKAASPKYTEALVDTAQTITVIKKELIEQQGAATLTEALRNTPGVGTFFVGENGSTSTGDAIYMRGFDSSTSIYVDGARDVGSVSRDVFNIEQIDVLKGPAGTDNGRAAPTGSINLVSKVANMEASTSAAVTVGTASQRRATVDVNTVLDADKGTSLRINVLAHDSGNPARDAVKNKRWAVAPSLAFGLNGKTRLFLNYLHVDQHNVPDGAVPTIGLPGYTSPDARRTFLANAPRVDPNGFYGSSTDYDKVMADMFTARVEHEVSPALRLQNITRFGRTKQDYLLTAFKADAASILTPVEADRSTWTLARATRTLKDQENTILTNQSIATFSSGIHTIVGGLELTAEKQTNYGYNGTGTLLAAKLYAPDPSSPVSGLNLVRNGVFSDATVNTQSAYGFDTIKLGEDWIFNGGVRLDHFSTTYSAAALSTAAAQPTLPAGTLVPANLALSDTLVNGKLSALYKPTSDSSVYALLATSKAPPGTNFALSATASSATNPKYDPQETTTTEVGTKWDFLKQKLSITGALYRTVVKNEVEQDPVDLLYYQSGKKSVQGIEIGMTGEVARNWLVSAGYAHMNTQVDSGKALAQNGSRALTYTPKDSFTAWTSYSLVSGLKIGGGARYVGKLLRGTDSAIGTPAYADAYWVFDAMVSYAVSKNVSVQLNAYNLGDTLYIAAINKSGYRYTPGAPRSLSLNATLQF